LPPPEREAHTPLTLAPSYDIEACAAQATPSRHLSVVRSHLAGRTGKRVQPWERGTYRRWVRVYGRW
jgi:hypothetical protein